MAIRLLEAVATIADEGTVSTVVTVRGALITGLLIPAGFVAGTLTPAGSIDGTNFFPMFDDAGVAVAITAAASRLIYLLPAEYSCLDFFRLTSSVVQTAGPINIIVLLRSE